MDWQYFKDANGVIHSVQHGQRYAPCEQSIGRAILQDSCAGLGTALCATCHTALLESIPPANTVPLVTSTVSAAQPNPACAPWRRARTKVCWFLDDDLLAALKAESARLDMSVAALIRRALRERLLAG